MGKYVKKKEKKSRGKAVVLILCGLVLAAFLVLHVMPRVLYYLSGEEETPVTEQIGELEAPAEPVLTEGPTEMVPGVEYPVELETGLILDSLFQFEGLNPDCGMESGSAIASVTLQNVSESFLAQAQLELELADGRIVEFSVTNLPAGKTAMAFALDNAQLGETDVCVNASCTAVWDSAVEAAPEGVSVSAEGTTITITNNTAQDIPELRVYCRDPFDATYFGGKAQEYIVNTLSANGTATVEAQDSILGLIEVVRVEISE